MVGAPLRYHVSMSTAVLVERNYSRTPNPGAKAVAPGGTPFSLEHLEHFIPFILSYYHTIILARVTPHLTDDNSKGDSIGAL